MQKVRMQIVKPTIECTVQFDMANGDNDAATPEHVPKNLVYKCQGARSVFGLLADVLCMPRGSAGIWLKVCVKPCRQVVNSYFRAMKSGRQGTIEMQKSRLTPYCGLPPWHQALAVQSTKRANKVHLQIIVNRNK